MIKCFRNQVASQLYLVILVRQLLLAAFFEQALFEV